MNVVKTIVEFITEGRKKKTDVEKKEHIEGISILDQIGDTSGEQKEELVDKLVEEFIRPNGPTIYAFVTDKVNDAIKVGYTDQQPEKRIEQWKEIYGKNSGEVTCLGYWSSEEFNNAGEKVFFWDHAIHKKIRNKGYKQLSEDDFMSTLTDKGKEIVDIHYSREFFDKYKRLIDGQLNPDDKEELSAELIEDIIKQMKNNIKEGKADFKLYSFDKDGKTSGKEADKVWGSPVSYSNNKLQEEAIENGIKAIQDNKKNILMAAVMRFGKTHASYEIVKGAGCKKVIVCSAKADVRNAWRDDINHKDFYKDFIFIEVTGNNNWKVTYCKEGQDKLSTVTGIPNIESLEKSGKTLIYFFTLHDLAGSINTIKEKHKNIFDKEFDLMIIDETHYGSHANTFGKVTKLERSIDDDNSDIEEEQKIAQESTEALKKLDIKYKTVLQVSGTPYYILASNEMIQEGSEIISKVSYTDMLNARDEWNKEHKDEDPSKSPYYGIPTLHKIGLKLTKECNKILKENGVTDSLTELFKTKGNKFVYEDAVKSLMKSVFGDGSGNSLSFLSNKKVEGNKVCKHTLMVLPRINACNAMENLLKSFIDTNSRHIFNIVGGDHIDVDSLNNKLYELDDKGKKSIILTVNRFLTGVSMPCVDSMIYLKNASSPQEYDQNIFRLCTRYVKTVKNSDNESRSNKVNMKDNVYLIDFNISNMLKMVANSAQMKAAAEGDPRPERIKELMEEDLGTAPIFAETNSANEILSKMKKLDKKDLMEIYTGYNKNKSIADIVSDEIDLFEVLFTDKKYKGFQDIIMDLDIEGDKTKLNMEINDTGDDSLNMSGISGEESKEKNKQKYNSLPEFINKNDDKKREKLTKEKFKAITKNLLYCNICLDEPCTDLESIIKKTKTDKEFKDMLVEFKVSIGDLWNAYKMMGSNFKQAYNSIIYRMAQLAQDSSADSYEKFATALKGLGRLDKNEVVTPPEIVEKMIDKLSKEDYEKAESILLVNEKQAEFFMELHKKFNGKYDDKCKIIASSEIGKHLCKKMLKSVGVKNYINNIIDIKDINGDGKYNVNDFLDMKNEDILKENNGKRFDIVLMNPPYGTRIKNEPLHFRFVEKCNSISNKQITIMPFKIIKATSERDKKWKDKLSKNLISVQEEDSKQFEGTGMPNVGIYCWDSSYSSDINIKYLNEPEVNVNSLLDLTTGIIKEEEKEIFNALDNDNKLILFNLKIRSPKGTPKSERDIEKRKLCEKFSKKDIYQNKWFLSVGAVGWGKNALFISSKNVGKIYNNFNDILDNWINNDLTTIKYIVLKSKLEAENCLAALQRPLLRLTLYRIQDDQNLNNKCYRYVPNIDWEDDRVKTDEGLLEVCGCPKNKCKEYADYCKKVIEQVDKK